MDDYEASTYATKILNERDAQIWRYRSGRLAQLVNWCTGQARETAVRTGCSEGTLEYYLHDALEFARDFHEALNPEGARLLKEGPPHVEEDADKRPYSRYLRITGTLWNHNDPSNHFAGWREDIARRDLVSFPTGCNLEMVGIAVDAYLKLPHIHHPWLEWCMFDALIRAEAIAVADHAHLLTHVIPATSHPRRNRLERAIFARVDRRRAEIAAKNAAPYIAISAAMLGVYQGLSGHSWTISPTRVRETMAAVDLIGGRWPPACWVLIDRAIQRDSAAWTYEPP